MTMIRTSVQMPPELKEAADKYAERVNVPFSTIVRWALSEYLSLTGRDTKGLAGALSDVLCNCGYLLPSEGAIDPQAHKEDCRYRVKMEALK